MIVINGVEMYDTQDIARMTGLHIDTISRLRREGVLRYVQVGHKKLTSKQNFDAFLNGTTLERMQASEHVAKVLENLK